MKRFARCPAGVLGVLALAALFAGEAAAAVFPVPAAVSVAGGRPSTVTISYRFTGVAGPDGPVTVRLTSFEGTFASPGDAIIGVNPTTLDADIVNGSGRATETVTVPLSVLDTLRRQGFATMTYQRSFSNGIISESAEVRVSVTGEAAAAFEIQRIELYFENRRGEITIPRNHRGLKAFADIRFAGTGVLTGFWEVDGRRILDVNRQLSFGTNVTLSTPDVPDLPTFDTGAHIVRFVVTNPAPAAPLPQLLYYVAAAKELRTIRISAQREEREDGGPPVHRFGWEKPEGIDLFFLEFSEEPGGKPVFSAFTREGSYALPDRGVDEVFTTGKRYYWRVKGYDANGEQVAESDPAAFHY